MSETGAGPVILVVDDDPMNRRVMGALLRKLGYQHELATNGREAIELVRQNEYAAILMDCLMPEMDGYAATAAIRQEEREARRAGARRHLPIIAITAVAIQGARDRCISAGMDDYLSKPVVASSVAAVLEHWLSGAGSATAWSGEQDTDLVAPDEPVIDRQALETLGQLDPEAGDTLIAEVVQDFGTEVSARIAKMRVALASGNTDTLLQELHSIAGSAPLVGAARLEAAARSLEASISPEALNEAPDTGALIDRLEATFTEARLALESIVGGSDGEPRS